MFLIFLLGFFLLIYFFAKESLAQQVLVPWALLALVFLITFAANGEFAAIGTTVVGGFLMLLILISSIHASSCLHPKASKLENSEIANSKTIWLRIFALLPILLTLPIFILGTHLSESRTIENKRKLFHQHFQSASKGLQR